AGGAHRRGCGVAPAEAARGVRAVGEPRLSQVPATRPRIPLRAPQLRGGSVILAHVQALREMTTIPGRARMKMLGRRYTRNAPYGRTSEFDGRRDRARAELVRSDLVHLLANRGAVLQPIVCERCICP